jgi:hypothetical protein
MEQLVCFMYPAFRLHPYVLYTCVRVVEYSDGYLKVFRAIPIICVCCVYLPPGLCGGLGLNWPVYVGQLCLLSVSVIWAMRGAGFELAGMRWPKSPSFSYPSNGKAKLEILACATQITEVRMITIKLQAFLAPRLFAFGCQIMLAVSCSIAHKHLASVSVSGQPVQRSAHIAKVKVGHANFE